MNIKTLKISDLKPAEYNPRKITKNELDKLKRNIKEFGLVDPLIVNSDMTVIGGHQRLKVLKALKYEECLCVVLDIPKDKEKALNLSLNRITGEWNDDLLTQLLSELSALENFDMQLTGFDSKEIDELLANINTLQEKEENFNIDLELTNITEPKTKPGDLYLLGQHRVLCGDSTIADNYNLLMQGKLADMIFTDPPYGVNYSGKNSYLNKFDKGNRIQTPIENDNLSLEDLKKLWLESFSLMHNHTRQGGSYYVTAPQGGELFIIMANSIKKAGFLLKHTLVWVKNNHILGRCDYHYQHEPIIYGWKPGAGHRFFGDSSETSVWFIDKPLKSELHPTMKPIELIERAIRNSSQRKEIVLDGFLGSGTTIIAAEKLGRICYGIELSPEYCDVIISRWERFTGQKAILHKAGTNDTDNT